MNVLVIGSGGREHALVWKLKQSKKVERIFCAPGNGGISLLAKCVNIKPESSRQLIEFVQRNKIELTVVGPEAPLAHGIVDDFHKRKLKIFGPDKKSAQLESSKVFAKEFMQKYHVPTAPFRTFQTPAEAIGFCKSVEFPVVIKADGLAAGKGVAVVNTLEEAVKVIEDIMMKRVFGKAGDRLIVESCLMGQEVSLMALTDGKTMVPLLPSQDHKRAFEGDKGPNTGGMGAYCPTDFVTPGIMEQIQEHILNQTMNGLRNEEITYCGLIYAGLMLTANGPKVLEFNCRFGDPETQAVLPLLKTDFAELLTAVVDKKLGSFPKLEWRKGAAACVVLASKGYPGQYNSGVPMQGLPGPRDNNCVIFHSGTRRDNNNWFTAGGRVLGVTGIDDNLKAALDRAYSTVKKVRFDGAQYRRDIGAKALQPVAQEQNSAT
ncbi:MAG TPA: phosphoribosylamine--glycine ligase [Candidatus Acidoferrum sp.]|nr:phosphoribosylamine--glycine ligase [Candidatus Acidoferrum sp.]